MALKDQKPNCLGGFEFQIIVAFALRLAHGWASVNETFDMIAQDRELWPHRLVEHI